jgi:hypothetical protein
VVVFAVHSGCAVMRNAESSMWLTGPENRGPFPLKTDMVSLYTLDANRLYPAYAVSGGTPFCVWWWRRYFSIFVHTRPLLHEPRKHSQRFKLKLF